LLRGRRDFSRGRRNCLAAIAIFSLPRYQFFHCRDTDFLSLISIFSSSQYQFFLAPPPGANLKHRAAPGANFSIAPRRVRISALRCAGREFQHRAADGLFAV
jgi:hypothetical protein